MILPTILALVALSVADPSGDAFGDGTLTPPTAPVYADTAVFDIRAVELVAVDGGTRLSVSLGSLGLAGGAAGAVELGEAEPPPAAEGGDPATPGGGEQEELVAEVPLTGFLPTVVDVYLVAAGPGFTETLPGPDLDFPAGTAWQYAVRISSDGAYLVAYHDAPAVPTTSGGGSEAVDETGGGQPPAVGVDPAGMGGETGPEVSEPGPGDMPRLALTVSRRGRDLVVYLPVALADGTRVQAMSGVYDPFSPTGWRALSQTPSPWAFSGADAQVSPVIDLVAADPEAQAAAIRAGVLPRQSEARAFRFTPWPYVMALGLLLAIVGLVSRGRVRPAKQDAAGVAAAALSAEEAGAVGAAGAEATTETEVDATAETETEVAASAAATTVAVPVEDALSGSLASGAAGAEGGGVEDAIVAAAAEPVVEEIPEPVVERELADGPVALPADEPAPAPGAATVVTLGRGSSAWPSDGPEQDSFDRAPSALAFGDEWEALPDADLAAGFRTVTPAAERDETDYDDDDDDDLYDPVATAADALAAEVAAADEAGAADQELLVDDTDELVLDTGEREAALGLLRELGAGQAVEPTAEPVVEPPSEPAPERTPDLDLAAEPASKAAPATSAKDPFGTEAGNTFLLPIDDPSAVEDFIDESGGEESFWHPRARPSYRRPPTIETAPELVAGAADESPALPETGGAPDEDADLV